MKKVESKNFRFIAITVIMSAILLLSENCANKKERDYDSSMDDIDRQIDDINPDKPEAPAEKLNDPTFTRPEQMPEFPGGQEGLRKYMQSKLKYPSNAQKEGVVKIQFIIDENGKPTNAVIVQSLDSMFDQKALDIIQNMPDWIPGKNKGKTVKTELVLPVRFHKKSD